MTHELSIDSATGSIQLGDVCSLFSGQQIDEVARLLDTFATGRRDHGNGYVWLQFDGFTFGSSPCAFSLRFFNSRLREMAWSVQLPGADDGWPTREEIDREILFVKEVLSRQLGRPSSRHGYTYPWGEVWSSFDPKGFLASNGARYSTA